MAGLLFLAEDAPVDPTTGKGPEWGKAAPIALLIILLMGIALFLLIKSMNRQLKKVPSDFMRGAETGSGTGTASAVVADPAGSGESSATVAAPPPVDAEADRPPR